MLYFIAQIWDLCFGDLREDFPLFCYLFPEAPSFCAGIWSSWTCVTAAGDAARRFYICIYCSALLFNFVVLVLAQRRSDANEGWIIWVADKQTPATPRAEAGGGGGGARQEGDGQHLSMQPLQLQASHEGCDGGTTAWARGRRAPKVSPTPHAAGTGGETAGKAGMPPKYTAYPYHASPCAEDNALVFHPGKPYFLL